MKPTGTPSATGTPRRQSGRKARGGGVIRLTLKTGEADSVFVAGTFNDWHPAATEMIKAGDGIWVKDLALAPGCHEYRFVVDGAWVADPANPATVPNPFGTRNSVLVVPSVNT